MTSAAPVKLPAVICDSPTTAVETAVKINRMAGHVRVAIVGAGFGGIGMSIRLAEAGIEHVIFERAAELGGTWRENRYPWCACDVPTPLYSYSFALNPDWSRLYAPQAEIWSTC